MDKLLGKQMLLGLIFTTGMIPIQAAVDLGEIHVYGDRYHDRFGNVVTEQSYYRTGGDVQVVDRTEIERRHYTNVGEALQRLPGINIRTPGYRGGEYGYPETHTIVSINGDDRVVVLVNGRRVDNSVSGILTDSDTLGSKALVDINQVVDMNNVESIEVIKGPGASAYGADAAGGVINIITRKGSKSRNVGLDVSFGSWGKQHYHLTLSGEKNDKLHYFVTGGWEKGHDLHYKDGLTKQNYRYVNTHYNDRNFSARVDYDFTKEKRLSISYSHMDAMDGYPLTAPYRKYMTATEWERIKNNYFKDKKYGNIKNPGYRNLFYMWAWTGAYNAYRKEDVDVTYTFAKNKEMESFVRAYYSFGKYWGSFGAATKNNELAPIPDTPEWFTWAKANYRPSTYKAWLHREKSYGTQVQLAKSIGKHDLIGALGVDWSEQHSWSKQQNTFSMQKRRIITGYIQDKIHLSDMWELTPSLRFISIGSTKKISAERISSFAGDTTSSWTGALATQYRFNDDSSAYLSWTQIYRPLKASDYLMKNGDIPADLKDERGNIWNIGYRKELGTRTEISINYSLTNMSNAVARYRVWDEPENDFKNKYVNAKQRKNAFNISVSHRFNDNWQLEASFVKTRDKWQAKGKDIFDPEIDEINGDVNTVINKLRPKYILNMNLAYQSGKFNSALTANYYGGCSDIAFTSKHFLVLDWSMNYQLHDNMSIYAKVNNLTNTAWESIFYPYLGIAAWPNPGRNYTIGMNYKF